MLKLIVVIGIVMCLANAATAAETAWTNSTSGGSTIEIPVFMTQGWVRALLEDGKDFGTAFEPEQYPVQLRQYRTTWSGTPFAFLSLTLGADASEVTYSVDRPSLGVLSGYTRNRREIFYGMCRKASTIYCFDMHYATEARATFDPIVARIAQSFR